MAFFETFGAVFTATIIGQVVVWWFKKEIEHRLDTHYMRLKSRFNKNGGINMKGLKLHIERTSNGKFLVDVVVKEGNIMNKAEVETSSFESISELADWLKSRLN